MNSSDPNLELKIHMLFNLGPICWSGIVTYVLIHLLTVACSDILLTTIIGVLETRVHVILVVVVIQTLHAAALPGFFRETLAGPLAVVAASSSPSAGLLATLRAVRVALWLAVVFRLAVAPRLLQAVWRRQVSHGQHALNGLLCAGRCRRLTGGTSIRNTQKHGHYTKERRGYSYTSSCRILRTTLVPHGPAPAYVA